MTSRHTSVIFDMAAKCFGSLTERYVKISSIFDDSITLFNVTQDSKYMKYYFAVIFGRISYSKASHFE